MPPKIIAEAEEGGGALERGGGGLLAQDGQGALHPSEGGEDTESGQRQDHAAFLDDNGNRIPRISQ